MIFANPVPNVGEGRIWLLGKDYHNSTQGTWVPGSEAAGQIGYITNSTHADSDEMYFYAYFSRGHYVGRFMYGDGTDAGKMSIYVGSLKVLDSYDMYDAAPTTTNSFSISPGFSISVPGLYIVRILVEGKNAASTDYYIKLYYLSFWRSS